jgi:hypothetical protein
MFAYKLTICIPRLLRKVFSDEFEVDGRTFNDGNDPRWTAINKNDCKHLGVQLDSSHPPSSPFYAKHYRYKRCSPFLQSQQCQDNERRFEHYNGAENKLIQSL